MATPRVKRGQQQHQKQLEPEETDGLNLQQQKQQQKKRVGKYSKKPTKEPHNFSAAKETNAKKQQGRQPGHPGCVNSGEEAPPTITSSSENCKRRLTASRAERGRNTRGKCGRAFSSPIPLEGGLGRGKGCYYDFGGAAGSLESRARVSPVRLHTHTSRECVCLHCPLLGFALVDCYFWAN